jgi:hypothetical protein
VKIRHISAALKVLLFTSIPLYFIVEFEYQEEFIVALVVVTSVLVVTDGFRFRSKEKKSIELGEKYDFRQKPWFRFGIVFVIFAILFVFNKLVEWNAFPDPIKRTEKWPFLPVCIVIPQLLKSLLAGWFGEWRTTYYATKEGLIRSMNGDEILTWDDFYEYTLLEYQYLIKFKKKNLKSFSIKYDADYFHDYKQEITSFLDQKLTRA